MTAACYTGENPDIAVAVILSEVQQHEKTI